MKIPETVADLMTKEVLTIAEDDTLDGIEKGMGRFRFRHLPVVRDSKLVGLITHRDLLRADSSVLSADREARDELIRTRAKASMVMQKDVVSVRPTATAIYAGELMRADKLGCLPVTEEDGTLVGIVTLTDYLRLSLEFLKAQRPADEHS